MAYALVTHTTSVAGAASSPSVDTSGANLLIACVSASAPAPAPSDSKSNTWHEAARINGGFGGDSAIFYAYSATVGSGHTFTANGTTPSGCFMAWSGATTSDPLDQVSAGGESQFSPMHPGTLTPTQNGALIAVVIGYFQQFTAPSIDSGYTALDFVAGVSAVDFSSADAYFVQPTAAAVNPAVTDDGLISMSGIQCSFLPAAAAAGKTFFLIPN